MKIHSFHISNYNVIFFNFFLHKKILIYFFFLIILFSFFTIVSIKVVYDPNGFVTAIDSSKFLFNARGQLTEYMSEGEVRVRYYYDQLSRVVGWTDSRGAGAQYFYTNPLVPQQVIFVFFTNIIIHRTKILSRKNPSSFKNTLNIDRQKNV